jgi:hypothetical protein
MSGWVSFNKGVCSSGSAAECRPQQFPIFDCVTKPKLTRFLVVFKNGKLNLNI